MRKLKSFLLIITMLCFGPSASCLKEGSMNESYVMDDFPEAANLAEEYMEREVDCVVEILNHTRNINEKVALIQELIKKEHTSDGFVYSMTILPEHVQRLDSYAAICMMVAFAKDVFLNDCSEKIERISVICNIYPNIID